MQTKRYEQQRESTLAAGAVLEATIQNDSERRANFHGIRFQGRLRADNASADNESHGYIILTCEPGGYPALTEAQVDSSSDLETRSEIIIAIIPWAIFGGSTNPVGTGTLWDWSLDIKTSRTCSKGSKLVGYVISLNESAKSTIVSNMLLSCFETTL